MQKRAPRRCWKKFRPYHVVVLLLIRGIYFPFLQSYFLLHFLETLISTPRVSTIFTVNSMEGLTDTNGYEDRKDLTREDQPSPFTLWPFKPNMDYISAGTLHPDLIV